MAAKSKWPIKFENGEYVEQAALLVLGRPDHIVRHSKALYHVRYDCCGTEATITRDGIVTRIRDGITLCKKCNARRGGAIKSEQAKVRDIISGRKSRESAENLLPEGVTPPTWAPPALAISLGLAGLLALAR